MPLTQDQKLEKSEIELLLALAKVREARQKIKKDAEVKAALTMGPGADMLRKSPSQSVTLNGRLYQLGSDGSYRPTVTAAPRPAVFVRGVGGGIAAERETQLGIEMIKALRTPGRVLIGHKPV